MTDNEIIKALEEAMHLGDAPIMKGFGTIVDKKLLSDTVALINRQKAEIESITEKFNCQQKVYSDLHYIIQSHAEEIKTVKSEAIKEFGKFLIDKSQNGVISVCDIPDYVVEMVGENNA